ALGAVARLGIPAAPAWPPLGRSAAQATKSYLEARRASKGRAVKLNSWNPPVSQQLAAAVAGVSVAAAGAAQMVEQGLGPRDEAEFVALTLGDIQVAAKLQPILKLLDDRREVASGTPSGARPQRRICDLPGDGLVRRLGVRPSLQARPAHRD